MGRFNAAIARELVVSGAAVAKHIGSLLLKLELPPESDGHLGCSPCWRS